MNRSLKFANALAEELRSAEVVGSAQGFLVAGTLHTRVKLAMVEILVPLRFKDLRRLPPQVTCNEPWMKSGAEWHNGPPLCWVIPEEWRDAMDWKGKSARMIISEGKQWLLAEVRYLINRHIAASLRGLNTWPAEWPYWSHYEAGVKEYRRAKRLS